MSIVDVFTNAVYAVWRVGAMVAFALGLTAGALDAMRRTPLREAGLFDAKRKLVFFTYALGHVLAFGAYRALTPRRAPAQGR